MSRAMNLSITEETALAHCRSRGIGVSAVEPLPDGGIRLVCMSSEGAELLRRKFKRDLMEGDTRRTAHRPTKPLW